MAKDKSKYNINIRKEAINTLRTNIQFSSIDNKLQVIGFTSAASGEGKTTLVDELAESFALTGEKVLVLNADMRKGSDHKSIRNKNRVGITNVLAQNMPLSEAISEVKGFQYLGSGPLPPNPTELLGSKAMFQLIETLKNSYDLILVDTPPMGLFSDALVLSKFFDGFLITCAVGMVKKEDLRSMLENMERHKINIKGIVTTMTEIGDKTYGRYGDYNKKRN